MTESTANSRLVIGSLVLAGMLPVMGSTAISPALPAIQAAYNQTPNAEFLVRLMLTLPALSVVVCSPLVGALVDRFGRTAPLIVSTGLFALAGGAGYVIDSLYLLLASRAILGVAIGGIMVTSTTLITDYFNGDKRESVLGWQGAAVNLGGAFFLVIGGVLTDFGWRAPFLAYLFALVLLPLLVVSLHEPRIEGEASATETRTTFAEVRRFLDEVPILTLGTMYMITLVVCILFYLIPIQLPFYLEVEAAVTGTLAGTILATYNISGMVFSSQFQRLNARFGLVLLVALVFGLMGTGYVIIGLSSAALGIVLGLLVAGLGWGLLIPIANTWVSQSVTQARRGRALGGVSSVIFLGQFLSPIVSQPVIEWVSLASTYGLAGLGMLLLAVVFVIGNRWYELGHQGALRPSSGSQ
ncbi:MFS transporter (plasmid) [Salinigranum rubrum]|uniref:MFS transporter n=1 Tax=Salinigranum rubrum TaxID=755307 RepID=A0A2I8VS99_9EURY|nr:MFS transporter [Salinigranum rubrum]AUV84089.1 MFS transporter [Salinigranum rubrum]